jgi:hypothetical protein
VSFIKVKATLAKQFHIQPSEIDQMPMWEYEFFVDHIQEMIKEENKENEEQEKKYNVDKYSRMTNPAAMQRSMQSSMPKMPSMPKY